LANTLIQLILASRSPRRAQLLTAAGWSFVQADPPYDDPPQPPAGDAKTVAMTMAQTKAASFAGSAVRAEYPNAVIVAADTLIAFPGGELAGTPTSRDEAGAMILRFFDAWHDVVTGVAIWQPGAESPIRFADVASVWLDTPAPGELDAYLHTDLWQGKAGGYNLYERQLAGWSIDVKGEPTTVVGLPMPMVDAALRQAGLSPTEDSHP